MAELPYDREQLRQLLTKLQTPLFNDFLRATVPIFISNDKQIEILGSGVLFKIASHHFLISAAHVFDKVKVASDAEGWYISLGTGASPNSDRPFVDLKKTYVLLSAKTGFGREDDPLDVAVAKLPDDIVEVLLRHRRFLNQSELDPHDPQSPMSRYALFGYPTISGTMKRDERMFLYTPFLLGTQICTRDRGELHPPPDPNATILLDFSTVACATIEDGKPGTPPDPRGISGCGIWRIIDGPQSVNRWKPDHVKLVGIETGYREDKLYIRGTRINVVLNFLVQKYPEVRSALALSVMSLSVPAV
jgi:hypothetical protein